MANKESLPSKRPEKVNVHKNHRMKMKTKYYESGFNGMALHNVLEMLLYFGIPQKDTNPMAHELIERFGSFSGVLEAKREQLLTIKGMTDNAACLITMVLPLYKAYIQDLERERKVLSDYKAYAEFFIPKFLDTTNERVYALCLDSKDQVILYRALSEGDFANVNMDLRKLASLVLETQAKKVVICHNHPHGINRPSRADVLVTQNIYNLLEHLKVRLVDHIIIADKTYFAMSRSIDYAFLFYGEKVKLPKE